METQSRNLHGEGLAAMRSEPRIGLHFTPLTGFLPREARDAAEWVGRFGIDDVIKDRR